MPPENDTNPSPSAPVEPSPHQETEQASSSRSGSTESGGSTPDHSSPQAPGPAMGANGTPPRAPDGGGAGPDPAEGESRPAGEESPTGDVSVGASLSALGESAGEDALGEEVDGASLPPEDDAGEGEGDDDGEEEDSFDAAAPGDGERPKKKRRRRKKKKPGASEHPEAADKRGARPASDRAPFHVGEEVFGKVTAVLDTAIMIDLSGKALAIFDRQEMEPDDLVPAVGDRFVARVHNDGVRGGLVVLTRKPLREEEVKPKVEQASKDGSLVDGLVTGAIKGGVEVDIDGLRAFAPASGMDLHPANANFTALVGQRLAFRVLQYKNNGRDIVVTRRPMLEAEAHERRKIALTTLQEGQVLKGVVRTVVEWGAFVALPEAENLEGLVHISEASHDPRTKLTELVKPGDQFEVQITKIDDKGKIWLSRKALIQDPWAEARAKFAPGTRLKGKVSRLESFGAFVEVEEGLEGLVHIADLTMERVEHANEVLKEGQELEVVVHHFDQRNRKLALHPAPKPEHAEEERQKVTRGATVQVEVVKADTSGVVCRVLGATGRAARGFIPAGQTGTSRGTDLRKHFKAGARLDVKVMDLDPRRGEPKLSIRALKDDEERKAHKEYRQKLKAEGGFGTLGDLLSKHLERK